MILSPQCQSLDVARPPSATHMTIVGLISDTHSLLRPEAPAFLEVCDRILHAGDIGRPEVIEKLSSIAPVTPFRGNIDKGDWAIKYPDDEVIEVAGKVTYALHNLHELDLDPVAAGFDVVLSGHSHQLKIERKDGILHINTGSAGPR